MSSHPAHNTAENRAIIIESERVGSGQVMSQAVAGAFLQVTAMPDGVAKTRIFDVARVVGNTWGPMSIPYALGCAFLMKTSDPIGFVKLARDVEAAAANAPVAAPEETIQIHELPREIRREGNKHIYVFGVDSNLTTFAAASSAEEALEIVKRPGHPHYNCTVEEINAVIAHVATRSSSRAA